MPNRFSMAQAGREPESGHCGRSSSGLAEDIVIPALQFGRGFRDDKAGALPCLFEAILVDGDWMQKREPDKHVSVEGPLLKFGDMFDP